MVEKIELEIVTEGLELSPEDCASMASPAGVLVAAWVMKFKDVKFKDAKMTKEQARMRATSRIGDDKKGILKRIGHNFPLNLVLLAPRRSSPDGIRLLCVFFWTQVDGRRYWRCFDCLWLDRLASVLALE